MTEASDDALGSWLRSIGWAVLGCAIAIIVLIGFVLVALYQINGTLDAQQRASAIAACTSEYAATGVAWDTRQGRLFGELVAASIAAPEGQDPDPALIEAYTMAGANADEMTRRRVGLVDLAREPGPFSCSPVPPRLMIAPIDPTDPDPP